jgi:hypothetical protein
VVAVAAVDVGQARAMGVEVGDLVVEVNDALVGYNTEAAPGAHVIRCIDSQGGQWICCHSLFNFLPK